MGSPRWKSKQSGKWYLQALIAKDTGKNPTTQPPRAQYLGIYMNKKQTSARPRARDHPAVFVTGCPKQVPFAISSAHPHCQLHSTVFATWFAPFSPSYTPEFPFPRKIPLLALMTEKSWGLRFLPWASKVSFSEFVHNQNNSVSISNIFHPLVLCNFHGGRGIMLSRNLQ